MSEKKGLLPIVTEEIGYKVQEEYESQGGKEYTVALLSRIAEDNPCIANFISQTAMGSKEPKIVAEVGLLVYRLLESQAEKERLN